MALGCRILLACLLPLLAAVPVDAYVLCTFRPTSCTPTGCVPEDAEPAGCGGCAEESEEPEEEPETPVDCCCVSTVVARAAGLPPTQGNSLTRLAGVHIPALTGRTPSPEPPPPLR